MTHEELLAECEKHGLSVISKKENKFLPIARFDRGVGPEYVTLKSINATTINDAQKQADEQANIYFKTIPEAVVSQVKIRLCDE